MEKVDTIDDLKSSRSVQGDHFPNFEMLDAKIASALNKITENSYFEKRVSLEEQKAQLKDRFLRGRLYENFRGAGAHETVLDYADLFFLFFAMMMFRNSIRGGTKNFYQ